MKEKLHYDVVIVGAGNGGLSAGVYLAKQGKKVLVLEKHNLPGGCSTSFRRGRFEFEATLHEMCQMGEGKTAGQVRRLVDDYGLRVKWVPIDEAFCSISLEKNNAFYVSMPVGVKAFVNEMEKVVPGCRASVETFLEFGRMFADGVEWLASYNNEPGGLAKMKMLFKWKDLMKLVPVDTDTMLRKIGMPDMAREIIESYWDYIGTPSDSMSFAVYSFMTYNYVYRKPYEKLYDLYFYDNGKETLIEKNVDYILRKYPNISIESIMTMSALFGVLGSYWTQNAVLGLLIGLAMGVLMACLVALFSMKLGASPILVGVALNTLYHLLDNPSILFL